MSRLVRFNDIVLDLDRLICAYPSPADRGTGLVLTFEGMSEELYIGDTVTRQFLAWVTSQEEDGLRTPDTDLPAWALMEDTP